MGACISRPEQDGSVPNRKLRAGTYHVSKAKGEAGAKPAASSQKRQHLLKHGSGGTDLDPDDSFRIESSPGAEHGEHTLSPTLSPSTSDAADSQLSSRPGSGEHNQAGDSPPVSPHSRAAAHSNGGDGVLSSVPSSAHGEVHLDTAITHHFHGTSLKRLKSNGGGTLGGGASSNGASPSSARSGAAVSWAQDVLKDNQTFVLKTTAGGRLMRGIRSGVPEGLLMLCQALVQLYDLSRAAHYHTEACKLFLRRCVMVQDLVGEREDLMACGPLHQQLLDVVQDAHDLFAQFSERGWLARMSSMQDDGDSPSLDQQDFERIDAHMVAIMSDAGADADNLADTPQAEVATPATYVLHHQQLTAALARLGGMAGVAENVAAAAVALGPHVTIPAPGTSAALVMLLEHEVEHWQAAVAGGAAAVDALRHQALRCEWRRVFGAHTERVAWREFWSKLVSPHAKYWALEGRLDKFTPQYLQGLIERGIKGRATLAQLDFAFPPNYSAGATVNAMMAARDASSNRLQSISSGGRRVSMENGPGAGSQSFAVGAFGPEPAVRLHNFPEAPTYNISRSMEVANLTLSMQDMTTNTVVLIGPPGNGKTQLAATLGQELVAYGQWSEAYWVDLQGVTSQKVAGNQILAALGLTSDQPDPLHVLAWLEERGQERFGIVLAHAQELLGQGAAGDGQAEFLEFVERMLQAARKLQVVLVTEDRPFSSNYTARLVEVQGLAADVAKSMLREAVQDADEAVLKQLLEACSGSPLALQAAASTLRYGHCSTADFMRLLMDPNLPPSQATAAVSQKGLSRSGSGAKRPSSANDSLQRLLVVCAVCLPDELASALMVLAQLPAPFSYEQASQLMALPASDVKRRGMLRRLCCLGLLQRNAALQTFSMHSAVREAVMALTVYMEVPYDQSKRRYIELLIESASACATRLLEGGAPLAACIAWGRLEVGVCQVMQWAYAGVSEDMLPLYTQLAWECVPLLETRVSMALVQGFLQLCIEKAQAVDHHLEAAQLSTLLGGLLSEAGSSKRADQLLRTALEVLWRELKDKHPAIARCYCALGAALMRTGKLQDAASNLQQALDIQEALFGANSVKLAPVLTLLGEVRRKQRRFAEAEESCKRALDVTVAAHGEGHPDVAACNVSLSHVARMAGRFTEAEALLHAAQSCLEKALGPDHPRVIALVVQLGQLAVQQGRVAAAEQLQRKALATCQRVQGSHHPDTSSCLAQLVALLRSAGKAEDALPLAKRCLDIKEQAAGSVATPDVAAAVQGVAEVMLDLGRYTDVEKLCGRAANIHQQSSGKAPTKAVITVWTMQALALSLLGRASEAEAVASRALEAANKLPGEASERQRMVASCHNCHCEALRELGRLQEAEDECVKGLHIREKEFGLEHPAVALSLATLSTIQRARQQLAPALESVRRCAAIRAKGKGPAAEGPQMASALQQEALVRMDLGQLEEAAGLAARALEMRQRALVKEHPDVALSLMAVAEVHMAREQYADAERRLEEALAILEVRLDASHPQIKRAQQLLDDCADPAAATQRKAAEAAKQGVVMAAIAAELGSQAVPASDADAGACAHADAGAAHAAAPAAAAPGPRTLSVKEQAARTLGQTAAVQAAPAVPVTAAASVEAPQLPAAPAMLQPPAPVPAAPTATVAPAALAAAAQQLPEPLTQQPSAVAFRAASLPTQYSMAAASSPPTSLVAGQYASIGDSISASSGSGDLAAPLAEAQLQQQAQQQVQQQQQQFATPSRFMRPSVAHSVDGDLPAERSLQDEDEIREIQEYIRSRGWNLSVSQQQQQQSQSAPVSGPPSAAPSGPPSAAASAPATARTRGPPSRHHSCTGVFARRVVVPDNGMPSGAPAVSDHSSGAAGMRPPMRIARPASMTNILYTNDPRYSVASPRYDSQQYGVGMPQQYGPGGLPQQYGHGGLPQQYSARYDDAVQQRSWSPAMWDHSDAVLNPLYDDAPSQPWMGSRPAWDGPPPQQQQQQQQQPMRMQRPSYGPVPYDYYLDEFSAPPPQYHMPVPHHGSYRPASQYPHAQQGYGQVPHHLPRQGSGSSVDPYSPSAQSSGYPTASTWQSPREAAYAAAHLQPPPHQRPYAVSSTAYERPPVAYEYHQQQPQQQARHSYPSIPAMAPFTDAAAYGPQLQRGSVPLPRTASNADSVHSVHSAAAPPTAMDPDAFIIASNEAASLNHNASMKRSASFVTAGSNSFDEGDANGARASAASRSTTPPPMYLQQPGADEQLQSPMTPMTRQQQQQQQQQQRQGATPANNGDGSSPRSEALLVSDGLPSRAASFISAASGASSRGPSYSHLSHLGPHGSMQPMAPSGSSPRHMHVPLPRQSMPAPALQYAHAPMQPGRSPGASYGPAGMPPNYAAGHGPHAGAPPPWAFGGGSAHNSPSTPNMVSDDSGPQQPPHMPLMQQAPPHPVAGYAWGYAQPPQLHHFHSSPYPPQQHGMYGGSRGEYGGPWQAHARGPPPPARSSGYAGWRGDLPSPAGEPGTSEYWSGRRSSSWNDVAAAAAAAVPEDAPYVAWRPLRRSRSFDMR